MDSVFLSLLYPDQTRAAAALQKENRPDISETVCTELGLYRMLPLNGAALSDFFTTDPEVIAYRQEIFEDLMRLPELAALLQDSIPILSDILELRRMDEEYETSGESYLYSITEIELYISCVDGLARGSLPLRDKVTSRAFLRLFDRIAELSESEYYKELNRQLGQLSSRIREVKSVTIGVNLDQRLRPCSAGVISVNAEPFKSGELLDRILRMSFRNDSFTCIANLLPFDKSQSENRRDALNHAFYNALGDVFRSSVRAWRKIVGHYVLENTDFLLRILPEIEFLVRGAALLRSLHARGLPLCRPTLAPAAEKRMHVVGLYNPDVALQVTDTMVENEFDFDDNGRIFILTGPNRGGKSVITCAVGQLQAMAQLGLSVPAREAELSPVDGIFTHFPEGAEDTIDKGRLGEECARLREIFDHVTGDSLVLLDESLSSTGAYEASYIAAEILCGFGLVGCRCIFSTHLHELAASLDDINARIREAGGTARADTLVAGMEEGERSYRIRRTKPDGKSYARDIANRYGLSLEELTRRRNG